MLRESAVLVDYLACWSIDLDGRREEGVGRERGQVTYRSRIGSQPC
jgi:hypothetical protein